MRVNEDWQSQFDDIRILYRWDRFPANILEINPSDATSRGIESGDWVEVRNDNVITQTGWRSAGKFSAVAYVTEQVAAGVTRSYFLFGQGRLDMAANAVTPGQADPINNRYRYKLGKGTVTRTGESEFKSDHEFRASQPDLAWPTMSLQTPNISELDAFVLAGGDSRRMGLPKATLPMGGTSLVGVVVEALRPLFRQVIVVTRDKDALTGIDVEVLEDGYPLQGPLVGLVRGLSYSDAPWCFVAACDLPFLQPDVIREMVAHLGDCDAVVPEVNGRLQTLHPFYSSGCLPMAEELLAQGITSMKGLLSGCRVTELPQDRLSNIPGGLDSFRDLDTIEEYQAALRSLGSPRVE